MRDENYLQADISNIIEEIESLGKSDKRSLYNHTIRLLQHLLKLQYTSENQGNSHSWKSIVVGARQQIKKLIKESPSLKNELKKIYKEAYEAAVDLAAVESRLETSFFPKSSPWTIKQILEDTLPF